jgi:cytochrome c-type biogenesis protein CcmH/NrfF
MQATIKSNNMNELEQIVQQMMAEGQSDENINAVIAAYDAEQVAEPEVLEKPEAAVEETAPVVVETPEDTGSQLEDTSSELWFDASPEEAEKRLEELYRKTHKSKKNYNGLTGTMSSSPRDLSSEEQVYDHIASGNSAKIKEIEDSVTDEAIFENILEDYKDLDNQTVARGSGMGSSNMVRESDGWDEKTRAKYDAWVGNGKNFEGEFGDVVKQSE